MSIIHFLDRFLRCSVVVRLRDGTLARYDASRVGSPSTGVSHVEPDYDGPILDEAMIDGLSSSSSSRVRRP